MSHPNDRYEKRLLRTMVRSAYDLQKLRIEMGNRLVAQFKSKLGNKPGVKEKEAIDEEGQKILNEVKTRWKKLTSGVARELPSKHKWTGDELISNYTEAILVYNYLQLERDEEGQFRRLESTLEQFPIYNEFLLGVRGCGPTMSAVIISEIDIERAKYPSSLWAYAGLDVVIVGDESRGRSRKKEHLRQIEYTDKNGDQAVRMGITFNPLLKTKLVGVLGPCLIRANSEPYRQIYDEYKYRLENHPKWQERTKGHRHNASIRYMVKRFLADLYIAWRKLENLPVSPEYQEAKLGMKHKKAA